MGENAARLDWAGAGIRLPWRLLSPRTLRLAVRRALADPALAARAREIAAWSATHDGPTVAARLIEHLAAEIALERSPVPPSTAPRPSAPG
jgi:UDP:flavonoid glycosyltransferase YjiC (YdhE family)